MIRLSTAVLMDELSRDITIDASHTGITVMLAGGEDAPSITSIAWDQLHDVEHLAEVYCYERVMVFTELVRLLGHVYANKSVYVKEGM